MQIKLFILQRIVESTIVAEIPCENLFRKKFSDMMIVSLVRIGGFEMLKVFTFVLLIHMNQLSA